MAWGAGEEFRRPVTLALPGVGAHRMGPRRLPVDGGFAHPESRLTASLRAAEKARETLAADLQNLQKAAGTAADLKVQAAEAEKALVGGVRRARLRPERTRRPDQADQRRQARHFRRPGRGEREDARSSVGRRAAQGGDGPADRGADPGSAPSRRSRRAAGPGRRCARPPLATPRAQTATAQRQLEALAPDQRGDRRAQRLSRTQIVTRHALPRSDAVTVLIRRLGAARGEALCVRDLACSNMRGARPIGRAHDWESRTMDDFSAATDASSGPRKPHFRRAQGRGAGQADLFGRQGAGGRRARATGFSPSRSPPATSSSSAGCIRPPRSMPTAASASTIFPGVPDRPSSVRRDDQSRRRGAHGGSARRSSAST